MNRAAYIKLEDKVTKLNRKVRCLQTEIEACCAGGGGSGTGVTYYVQNYNELIAIPSPSADELAYVYNDQGTKWLPGGLGGTYYPDGLWIYTGTIWKNDKTLIAQQLQLSIDDIIANTNNISILTTNLNNHVTDLSNPHQTPINGGDLITDVIVDDSVDYIYRGFNRNGDWEIERFDIEDINIKVVATEANNGIYTTLANAWTNRATLNYI